jgi:CHAD domain
VTEHDVPQPGEAIDEFSAGRVDQHRSAAAYPDTTSSLSRHIVQRVNQRGQVARCQVHGASLGGDASSYNSQRPKTDPNKQTLRAMRQARLLHEDAGMAFRLRTNESVARGLERIVRNELRAALDQLAGMDVSEDAIHEARKSVKKVRAVLQLVGSELGADGTLKQLRRAGQLLAPLRDADALVKTARELCARQSLSERTCTALRDRLSERQSRLIGNRRSRQANQRAARVLKKAHRLSKRWKWRKVRPSAFAAGVRRSYKEASRAMQSARVRQRAGEFHAWRKRVKALWYALRLLPRHQPFGSRLTELEHLESWLGEDQNLAVLRARLSSVTVSGSSRVVSLAEQRQRKLREKALATGARQFSVGSKELARRVERVLR